MGKKRVTIQHAYSRIYDIKRRKKRNLRRELLFKVEEERREI